MQLFNQTRRYLLGPFMSLKKIISTHPSDQVFTNPNYGISYPHVGLPFKKRDMTQNSKLKIKSLLEQAVRVKKPTSKPLIEETITNKKGKQLHMLWVPHNHSDPSIINETYRKITLFFEQLRFLLIYLLFVY